MSKTEAFAVALIVLIFLAMWWTLPRRAGPKPVSKSGLSQEVLDDLTTCSRCRRVFQFSDLDNHIAAFHSTGASPKLINNRAEKIRAAAYESFPRPIRDGGNSLLIEYKPDFEERQVVLIDNGKRLIPYFVESQVGERVVLRKMDFIPKKGQWKGAIKP